MSAMSPASMREVAQRVVHYGKTDLHLALRFGDYDLAIATNSGAMIEKLRHIYRHFLDDAPTSRFAIRIIDVPAAPDLGLAFTYRLSDDSDDESKDEFCDLTDGRVIRKRSNGILFASGDGIELAIGPCEEHETKTANFINSRYIQWLLHQGGVLAHAASVRSAKKGLVLAGNPGAGKTTLALRLLEHDLSLVGKDRVIVRREARGLWGYGAPEAAPHQSRDRHEQSETSTSSQGEVCREAREAFTRRALEGPKETRRLHRGTLRAGLRGHGRPDRRDRSPDLATRSGAHSNRAREPERATGSAEDPYKESRDFLSVRCRIRGSGARRGRVSGSHWRLPRARNHRWARFRSSHAVLRRAPLSIERA